MHPIVHYLNYILFCIFVQLHLYFAQLVGLCLNNVFVPLLFCSVAILGLSTLVVDSFSCGSVKSAIYAKYSEFMRISVVQNTKDSQLPFKFFIRYCLQYTNIQAPQAIIDCKAHEARCRYEL